MPHQNKSEAVRRLPVENLLLDARNPRLAGYLDDDKKPTQSKLLKVIWQNMAVDELAMSIAHNRYFDHEPLFVIPAEKKGHFTVIEGNRRLTAVKLLLDDELRKKLRATDLPMVGKADAALLRQLPVIEEGRENAWRYIGFKHVNGPQRWNSYAKAKYIAEVHHTYKMPLAEIAKTIGDKHRTVKRLYRALMVIEQAEREKVFHRDDRYQRHFSFSHLYTGLGYDGIPEFVKVRDLEDPTTKPIPKNRLKNLGELCRWLYGSKEKDIPPLIRSQNPDIRLLDEILQTPEGIVALRDGNSLADAIDASKGDKDVLHTCLREARRNLQKALGKILTGFDGESDLIELAKTVKVLAEKIRQEIEQQIGD